MTMRQLRLLVKKQEETIGSLLNLSFLLRLNTLPQSPEPVPFERQPRFSQTLIYNNQRIPMMTAHENNENPNNSSLSPTQIPKKNKGKEREPGPSYNLSSITSSITATTSDSTTSPIVAHPLSTSQDRTSSILSHEQVLRSASPHCNVVPTSTSKPVVPDALIKYNPTLVSEARPNQLVPPRPPNPLVSLDRGSMGRQGQTVSDSPHLRLVREPVTARVGPVRGFVDPYAVTAAHVSEYVVGYGAGYHLAEYTPGEAARVITDLPQGNASTSAVACANLDMNERCYGERETEGQMDNMNLMSNALPKIVGAAPIARSRQGGNSQVYNHRVASGGSVPQVSSFGRTDDHQNLQMAPLHHASFVSESQSQRTKVTGYQTESETSTTRSLGSTEYGMSTREVPQSHHTSGSGFSSALYGTTNPDETTTSSRTRPSHQTSLLSQSVKPISVPVTTVPGETTISAVVTTAEPSSARGTATHLTSDNVRTMSSPNTHSMPLLDCQGTGSSLDLNLRGFACGAGTTMMRSADVDLENRRPRLPEGMAVSHHNTGNSASMNRKEANDGNGFPILWESDEERTPLSRSLGTLAPLHALSDWSEVGCRAEDAFSTSHSHLQYDTYPSNQFNNGGSQSLLTSPTLFDSNSNTNALGLDGLNEPQPLHIAAPTPVVPTMSFLKSFSQ